MNPGAGGGDDGDDGGKRFSDWMDGARPLAKGKDRVPLRPTRGTKTSGSLPAPGGAKPGGASPASFRFPDDDQPGLAARSGVSDRQLRDLARGNPSPEEKIDLHGTRTAAARTLLEKRFESARARGLRSLVVVHGYGKQAGQQTGPGGSVLKERLPGWLTTPPLAGHILAIAPAPRKLGGAGATLVLLRKATPADRSEPSD